MEAYKPSEEENSKAENTMTEKQAELTGVRENQAKKLEELGVSGYLYLRGRNLSGERNLVEGKLNDHTISMNIYEDGKKLLIIDGEFVFDKDKTEIFFKKYWDIAIDKELENQGVSDAKYEIENSDKVGDKLNKILEELI